MLSMYRLSKIAALENKWMKISNIFCFYLFLSYYGGSGGIPVTEKLLWVGRAITPG